MASRLVELFSVRRFDFATLSASTTMDVEIVRSLSVVDWVEVMLELRVHALAMTSGGSIAVRLTPTSITPEDPSVSFLATAPLIAATVTSSTTAPALLTSVSTAVGGSFRLSVLGTRGSGAGSYWADLSAVLVGKR